ncbi:hypothetical protein SAMN02745163_01771 [Clostridium cavendishii DSM 21758]|uniref:Uncharacterized protein n=1 Tax=Clostridium cavendishii DSM 21758 TaxID=1121302 RepID=A0A1M6INN1_9CLOT|nr:hypothetical protein [Clostridium cavendishii]SHJ36056.1 hypothetical protein SAMN02745163_01771 [Clostridium cavendishii DSM 21758]
MIDYLKELCENTNIQLAYTKNKLNILSANISRNLPIIKAYIVFKNCPEEVAVAIFNYYTNSQNSDKHLITIQAFLKSQLILTNYKINLPNEEFKNLLSNSSTCKPIINSNNTNNELNILKIDIKNFWGSKTNIDLNQSIKATNDEPVELEVIVSPLHT